MGECEKCGKTIDTKYKFCLGCVEEMKKNNSDANAVRFHDTEEIIKSLGAINNNLYALRTIQEAILEKEYKLKLTWSKEQAKFLIEKKGKVKKV